MKRSDPAVFVVAAEAADVVPYGLDRGAELRGSGAGLKHEEALGAAVGEVAERYACAIVPVEDLVFGSYNSVVHNVSATAPASWALYTAEQEVPYPFFDADTAIAWIAADNLTQCAQQLVPASIVYMPYARVFAERGEQVVAHAVSTGAACSRSRAEAISSAIFEVIERDAFMIVWRQGLACPRLRIDEQSPLYPIFVRHFLRPGLEYHLFWTTLDLPVTSVFGYLRDTRRDPPAIMAGGAAHQNPVRAVLKTLLELVQGLKWRDWDDFEPFVAESGFDNVRSFEDRMRLYASNDLGVAFDFLAEDSSDIPLSALPVVDRGAAANVQTCVAGLAAVGLDILAVDLTTSDLAACGLNVVKVVIPQCTPMEGDFRMPFLGGDRWRKIPERLRKTARYSTVAGNPYPHPYP